MTDPAPENLDAASTIVIMAGASTFSDSHKFLGNKAFANSAQKFKAYLTDSKGLGLPDQSILNLFDDERNVIEQNQAIVEHLKAHAGAQNLIFHYVGHGGFSSNRKYFFALHSTQSGAEQLTGFSVNVLADTIDHHFTNRRVFFILDCCFAGEAVKELQSSELGLLIENETFDAFPSRGTALLAAASKDDVAISPNDRDLTMFSECLLDTLWQGTPRPQKGLSFEEVGELVAGVVKQRFSQKAVRPEVHAPRQPEGSLAKIPVFPNRGYQAPSKPKLPDELLGAINNGLASVRESAVRELSRFLNKSEPESGLSGLAKGQLRKLSQTDDSLAVRAAAEKALEGIAGEEKEFEGHSAGPATPRPVENESKHEPAILTGPSEKTKSSWRAYEWIPLLLFLSYSTPYFSGAYFYMIHAFIPVAAILGYRYGQSGIIAVALGGIFLPIGIEFSDVGRFPGRLDLYVLSLLTAHVCANATSVRDFFIRSDGSDRIINAFPILLAALLLLPLLFFVFESTLDNGVRIRLSIRGEIILYFVLWFLGTQSVDKRIVIALLFAFLVVGTLFRVFEAGGGAGTPLFRYTFSTLGDVIAAILSLMTGEITRHVLRAGSFKAVSKKVRKRTKSIIILAGVLFVVEFFDNMSFFGVFGPIVGSFDLSGHIVMLIVLSFLLGIAYQRKGGYLSAAYAFLAPILTAFGNSMVFDSLELSMNLGDIIVAVAFASLGSFFVQTLASERKSEAISPPGVAGLPD